MDHMKICRVLCLQNDLRFIFSWQLYQKICVYSLVDSDDDDNDDEIFGWKSLPIKTVEPFSVCMRYYLYQGDYRLGFQNVIHGGSIFFSMVVLHWFSKVF